jgi:hypothetical protein
MICGRFEHPPSACFDEVDAAVRTMTARLVAFNAHAFPAPPGAIIFNTENLPAQVPDWKERYAGHELWDMSARNCALTGAKHVPIGYHPSMQRFERAPVLDIDVIFTGSLNQRRHDVLRALAERGLVVRHVPPGVYGAQRDAQLARAKLALNMLFYEDGMYPTLRAAHLIANRVPILSEWAPEAPPWCGAVVHYRGLVDAVVDRVRHTDEEATETRLLHFRDYPMVLPC